MTTSSSVVAERDETGRIFYTTVGHSTDISAKKVRTVASLPVLSHPTSSQQTARTTDTSRNRLFNEKPLQALGSSISAIFLPAGYPNTVTPGEHLNTTFHPSSPSSKPTQITCSQ